MRRLVKKSEQIGYSSVEFISEKEDGELMDTKVIINDQLLCVIAGNTITEFFCELEELINKFRI
jgi:hypothetical protein